MQKICWFIIAFSLKIVNSEPPQYGPPVNNFGGGGYNYNANNYNNNYDNSNGNQYGGNNYEDNYNNHNHQGHHEDNSPKAYEFGYQVKDEYSGNNYNRQEVSDGNQVQGEYRVLLPDGRTQIVTYYADWQTGFHADVRYEGTAHFPEQYNNNNYKGNNQYGAPAYNNNNYNNNNYNEAPATSSVTIKDYSQGGYSDGYTQGNYGNKVRPTSSYGVP